MELGEKTKPMKFSVFDRTPNDATREQMFLGQSVNVQRYDQSKYQIFNDLTEKQKSFFWRPEEVDVSRDRMDFANLPEHEKHIFLSNLKYQTLLDSVQGRAPAIAFLPVISIPELEHWTMWWTSIELLHSFSYTHIIRNITNDPSEVFDDIVVNDAILKRASEISKYYDDLIMYSQYYNLFGEGTFEVSKQAKDYKMYFNHRVEISKKELMKKLYLCMFSVNALEAIRFYVSFACSFAFAERKLMEGNAKIIKFISRDESLHLTVTQHIINILKTGQEGELWKEVTEECEAETYEIFKTVVDQEKEWCKYLFKDGSMIGLNEVILNQYLEYVANMRMKAIGMEPFFPEVKHNPIPWINAWLTSDNVQVAPQEVEISSYLTSQVDSNVSKDDLDGIEL
jgi:ribonucleotide reductase, beta subunit|nr:MAG TPA: ribonucleotide-diphosphate reductase subunit beta [Caudoviricetes sp.]